MPQKCIRDRRHLFYVVTAIFLLLLGLFGVLHASIYIVLANIALYLTFFAIGVFIQNTGLFAPIFSPDPSVGRLVALTFDDGPDPCNTPTVLEILERYCVKATFFCVGKNAAKYSELMKRIDQSGHQVANHTYSHPLLINFYSKRRLKKELLKGQDSIFSVIGKRPKFFRQVAGIVNPQLGRFLDELDLVLVGWDIRTGDIRKRRADQIIEKVVRNARNGSIILLHDGAEPNVDNREAILVETLPSLIEGIKNRGFGFVTIEELYVRQQPSVDLSERVHSTTGQRS